MEGRELALVPAEVQLTKENRPAGGQVHSAVANMVACWPCPRLQ